MGDVTVYQAKGRNHIRYINRMMHNIWERYGYNDNMRVHALGEAFQTHINYLRSIDEKDKPKTRGTWWNENGVWIQL